ncbi:hypothetical protein [Ammoniphilus sp. YIM 78166]|uniref:hypothetical protein n=1 Tax=Ammoniphilus sp. YIM 78166 TaxID=1644106 RepID=UPI00106F70DE|nr:hypothetical protein [Ammoniphilus sp. YIM 78166]
MNRLKIEEWYQKECEKSGNKNTSQTPFHQKLMAFSLIMTVPVGLSGCSSSPEPINVSTQQPIPIPPSNSSDPSGPLTAYDECVWENEEFGWELDCGDSEMEWYKSKGYTNKHSYVPSTSAFYQKMRGGSKPVVTTGKSSSSSSDSRTLSTPSGGSVGGVGSGGTKSGGFTTGG